MSYDRLPILLHYNQAYCHALYWPIRNCRGPWRTRDYWRCGVFYVETIGVRLASECIDRTSDFLAAKMTVATCKSYELSDLSPFAERAYNADSLLGPVCRDAPHSRLYSQLNEVKRQQQKSQEMVTCRPTSSANLLT